MTLLVNVYVMDEAGEMVEQEPKKASEEMAGFEVYRTTFYGSDLAKRLGLTLLPTLVVGNIYAEGKQINQLKAEAEVMLREAAAFAEQVGRDADHVEFYADNIRKACIRARKMQGRVVIW